MLAGGLSYQAFAERLDTSPPAVGKWKRRFLQQGLDGLETNRLSKLPSKLTLCLRPRILAATRHEPADDSMHRSCRKIASHLGVSKNFVHHVWRETDLKPHRLQRYMASNDPDCERQAADIIGPYPDPL